MLAPGQTTKDTAVITNLGTSAVTLTVYATDAINTADGAFGLLTAAEKPTGLGSWISIGTHTVTVAPGRQVDVPFTVTVPAGATPGDHAAGIVASREVQAVGANNAKLTVDERVGSRVYLRVPGPLTPALDVTGLSVSYSHPWYPIGGSTAAIGYRLTNTGNVRLNGTAQLRVTGPFGIALGTPQTIAINQLLPGSAILGSALMPGVIPLGALTGHLQVNVVGANDQETVAVPTISASATSPAIPWLIVGVIVALLVIRVLLLGRRRRRRRAAAAPSGPDGPDVRDGSVPPEQDSKSDSDASDADSGKGSDADTDSDTDSDTESEVDADSGTESTRRVPVAAGRMTGGGSATTNGTGTDAHGDAPANGGEE